MLKYCQSQGLWSRGSGKVRAVYYRERPSGDSVRGKICETDTYENREFRMCRETGLNPSLAGLTAVGAGSGEVSLVVQAPSSSSSPATSGQARRWLRSTVSVCWSRIRSHRVRETSYFQERRRSTSCPWTHITVLTLSFWSLNDLEISKKLVKNEFNIVFLG